MKIGKKRIYGYIFLSLVTIISIFAFLPISKKSNNDSFTWMKNISDKKSIYELSIPGSHDSGATHSIFDVAGKCQDDTIKSQLEMGVRFFDIRLQNVNDEFKVVHSFVDQDLLFKKVLKEMTSFLKENNSEFIIMSVKKEADDKKATKSFEQVLLEEMDEYKDIICFDRNLPSSVAQARGKIYIISRYNDSTIGLNLHSNWLDDTSFSFDNYYIQDNYSIEDVNEKINDIKQAIEYSNNNKDKLVLNFTSCYLNNAFPPLYAGSAALKINPWFNEYVKDNDKHLGIIVADFVTEEMCKNIYMRNY